MKKLMSVFLAAVLLFAIAPKNVFAASGSAYLSGSSSVRAGQSTTIRLGFNGSSNVAGVQYAVRASGSLQIVGISGVNGATVSQSGDNVVQAIFSLDGLPSGTTWANITVRVPSGSSVGSTGTLTVSNIGMSLVDNSSTLYASNTSKTITVAEEPHIEPVVPKSSDATLKNLELKNAENFTFNAENTDYTVNVLYEVTSLDLIATPNDEKASYKVYGNENFVVGRNNVSITVTAEDGTTKTYNIVVIREPEKVECPVCEVCKKDSSGTIWMVISILLLLLLVTETAYLVYDKGLFSKKEEEPEVLFDDLAPKKETEEKKD